MSLKTPTRTYTTPKKQLYVYMEYEKIHAIRKLAHERDLSLAEMIWDAVEKWRTE